MWRDLLRVTQQLPGPDPGSSVFATPPPPFHGEGAEGIEGLGGVVVRGAFGDSGCKNQVLLEG